jgi:translocation and assembly module TamA
MGRATIQPPRAGLRLRAMLLAALLGCAPAFAAQVVVTVDGVEGTLHDAVVAGVEAAHYGDRDVSAAQARRLFENAREEAASALEPLG